MAGWSYEDWVGLVYPRGVKGSARLEYLARYLDLVEINTSFYGPIRSEAARAWCQAASRANPRFIFTAKLYRAFTHAPSAKDQPTSAREIRWTQADLKDTRAGLDALASAGKLGAVLAQFPMSFKQTDENRAYVEKLRGEFREYPLALEVRHASWNRPEILAWLAQLGLALCNIDQPLLGRAIRPSSHATSSIGYIRLHGRNYSQWFAETTNARDRYDYLYSEEELHPWAERAKEVASQTQATFVVTNNHANARAVVNAFDLIHMIMDSKVSVPPALLAAHPRLEAFAAPRP